MVHYGHHQAYMKSKQMSSPYVLQGKKKSDMFGQKRDVEWAMTTKGVFFSSRGGVWAMTRNLI